MDGSNQFLAHVELLFGFHSGINHQLNHSNGGESKQGKINQQMGGKRGGGGRKRQRQEREGVREIGWRERGRRRECGRKRERERKCVLNHMIYIRYGFTCLYDIH